MEINNLNATQFKGQVYVTSHPEVVVGGEWHDIDEMPVGTYNEVKRAFNYFEFGDRPIRIVEA